MIWLFNALFALPASFWTTGNNNFLSLKRSWPSTGFTNVFFSVYRYLFVEVMLLGVETDRNSRLFQ